jgi:hypothetical protein
MALTPVCYLCGKPIEGKPSSDHVPPQQFYAPSLRQKFNLDSLTTLPTHDACNIAFARDEEYAVASLLPSSIGSPSADAIFEHQATQFKKGEKQGLIHKVLQSFERRPSGLILPRNLVAIKLEGSRIKRVVWKIVRGLFAIETGDVLPENTTFMLEMDEPENRDRSDLHDFWERVKAQPSKGKYQGVFAYKYLKLEAKSERVHLWAMLWWDGLIWYVAHLDPGEQDGG